MSTFTVYALAAPLNAFLWCAFITFFLKNFHLKSHIRMTVTYIIYLFLAFAQCAGGNGILNIDMSVFNRVQFIMFSVAGLCVCIGIYFYYEHNRIGAKLAEKKNAKKGK